MKKGTQAMLDAAEDDATLLPFDTVFVTRFVEGDSQSTMPDGILTFRAKGFNDDSCSVAFSSNGHDDYWYCDSKDLLPAKKSKPKKWQNGTQAQLDAAKDDARLIPKKTYFFAKDGDAEQLNVFKIDHPWNNGESVAMMHVSGIYDFYHVECLDPIND